MKRLRNDRKRRTPRGGFALARCLKSVLALAVLLPSAAFAQGAARPPMAASTAGVRGGAGASGAASSADFSAGEELFQLNKPAEAIQLFERVLSEPQPNPAVYVYLGVAYYQLESYQKSLDVCMAGLSRADTDHKILAYNAGNSAYALADYRRADSCYAIALKADEGFAPAHLNLANARLKQDKLEDARESYVRFLELDSQTPQREAIEGLLALLDEEIARRAAEQPELVVLEDAPLPVDPFYGEIIEESDAPALASEPPKSAGELVSDGQAPVVPNPPDRNVGERVDGDAPAVAAALREGQYGERLLTRDELLAPYIPAEQLTESVSLPAADDAAREAVTLDDEALLALPEPPVADAPAGEIVREASLPVPDTTTTRRPALEAVDGDDGELPPMDYWED